MDIVEQLRRPVDPDDPDLWVVDRDRLNAANEINRLRAALTEEMVEAGYEVLVDYIGLGKGDIDGVDRETVRLIYEAMVRAREKR
jgi:hypothetical protein